MDWSEKEIRIKLTEKSWIQTTFFNPKENILGAVMIAPATGIKRKFYDNFARYLAQNQYAVITYDNQGIGESLSEDLRFCNIRITDWGLTDMPKVLEQLKSLVPDVKYHLVGHSAGGQLVGLMHNWSDLTSIFNFACSSGSLKQMKVPFAWKARFFMNVFIPLSNSLFGFTKTHWLGMGAPLPRGVAQEWSRWCNGSGYIQVDLDKRIKKHFFKEVNLPSYWMNTSDDFIANDRNVEEMIKVYPKLKPKRLHLIPSEYDLPYVGHMKFFTRQNNTLWPIALDWLHAHD